MKRAMTAVLAAVLAMSLLFTGCIRVKVSEDEINVKVKGLDVTVERSGEKKDETAAAETKEEDPKEETVETAAEEASEDRKGDDLKEAFDALLQDAGKLAEAAGAGDVVQAFTDGALGLLDQGLSYVEEHGGEWTAAANDWLKERWDEDGTMQKGSGSVSAASVKDLEIVWVSGSVKILPGEGNEITFTESGEGLKAETAMNWKLDGSELKLYFCEPRITIGLNETGGSKNLVVTVPAALRELQLELISGDAFIEVDARELEIETVNGRVTAAGTYTEAEGSTVNGDLELKPQTALPEKIEFNSVSGDLLLQLPAGEPGFEAEIDSVSGKLSCSIPMEAQNGRMICRGGGCRIKASTVSGDVRIAE